MGGRKGVSDAGGAPPSTYSEALQRRARNTHKIRSHPLTWPPAPMMPRHTRGTHANTNKASYGATTNVLDTYATNALERAPPRRRRRRREQEHRHERATTLTASHVPHNVAHARSTPSLPKRRRLRRGRESERGAGERGELRRKGEREAKHRAVHGTLYRRWALEQTRSGAPLASAQYGSFWAGMRPYPARSLGRERSRGRDRAIYGRLAPRLYHSALVWQARTVATPCAPCAAAPLPLRPAPLFWCGGHLPLSPLLCRVALVLLVSSGAIRQEEQCCAGGENRARAAGCCTPPSFLSMPTNQPSSTPPTRHRGISAVVVALSLAYRR